MRPATALTNDPIADLYQIPPEDLVESELSQLRERYNNDLFAFCWGIFGYQDIIGTLHGDLCAIVERWANIPLDARDDEGDKRVMVQIPREFFKTSVLTRANALWQVCRNPDLPVVIFNERLENTQRWIRAIRDVVQGSKLFQVVYRDLLPPGVHFADERSKPHWWKWSDTELQFQRGKLGIPEASITGSGIEAASTGGHWPIMILDDLISIKAALSPSEMERAREWVRNHVYLMRPAERGKSICVCTPWTYNDIYVDLARDFGYKVYRRQALEDGESIFPQKLTTLELLKMQQRDPYTFSSQMMCKPKPGRQMAFDVDWFRHGRVNYDTEGEPLNFEIDREHYDPTVVGEDGIDETPPRIVPLHQMEKVVLWDPAPSEKRDRKAEPRARNGIVVEGMDPWGRRFLLETLGTRDDPLDTIRCIFALMDKWGVETLGIEEVTFSILYRHWINDICNRTGRYVRVAKLEPGKQHKDARILTKSPGCRQGLYYLNTDLTRPFVQEIVEHPYGETRDILDAWAYDDDCLRRPLTIAEHHRLRRERNRYRELETENSEGQRVLLTGY